MVELYISNRIKFNQKGVQSRFLINAKKMLNLTGVSFSKKLNISQRTLTDWSREKFHMSEIVAKKIFSLTGIPIPMPNTVFTWNEHMKNIGKKGARARLLKYGSVSLNESYRKKKWREWWDEIGQYKKPALGFQSLIKNRIPRKNKLLAEFVGIMLGDGGITNYQICVTLSIKEGQYTLFVTKIIKKLFGTTATISKLRDAEAVKIVVSRRQLVDFCQEIGLVKGNKIRQRIDIPEWIKADISFAKVCVRGLIDTDGCFYVNSYNSNNKIYTYFKIAFVSASVPLLKSVQDILHNSGIHSVICYRKGQKGGDVRIVSHEDVTKYVNTIGSNNEKHLKKIREWQNL